MLLVVYKPVFIFDILAGTVNHTRAAGCCSCDYRCIPGMQPQCYKLSVPFAWPQDSTTSNMTEQQCPQEAVWLVPCRLSLLSAIH